MSWVIVDDGSDDGMGDVADDLARRYDWILVVGTGEDAANLAKGRRRGRDLLAFRVVSAPAAPWTCSSRWMPTRRSNPTTSRACSTASPSSPTSELRAAAATSSSTASGERIKVSGSHPRGASRAYRWALLDDVFALEPELGWDGVDEVMAELRGYRTAGFTDFGFRHHRKVGERDGRLRAGSALGRQAWYMGYSPSYLVFGLSTEPARTSPRSRWSGAMPRRRPAELRSARIPSPTASAKVSVCVSSCDAAAGPSQLRAATASGKCESTKGVNASLLAYPAPGDIRRGQKSERPRSVLRAPRTKSAEPVDLQESGHREIRRPFLDGQETGGGSSRANS